MKNIFIVLTLIWFGFIANSFSADFQKGLDAARSGDYVTALKEWRPLAQQGDADAQYNLGTMYRKGDGVLQDYQEALKWYRLAAEQGYPSAQYNLGSKYRKGEGILQDYKEAVKWYRLSAEQGHANSQTSLGVMYARGWGVIQDKVLAHMWHNISASNGSEQGKENKDIIVKQMTERQIEDAQRLARQCVKNNYKGC